MHMCKNGNDQRANIDKKKMFGKMKLRLIPINDRKFGTQKNVFFSLSWLKGMPLHPIISVIIYVLFLFSSSFLYCSLNNNINIFNAAQR